MDSSNLTSQEAALFAIVPTDGSTIGRQNIQTQLGWTDELYWLVRDSLVDKGLVVRRPGRGGTLSRVLPAERVENVAVPVGDSAEAQAEYLVGVIRREEELYDPLQKVLANDWARDHRFSPLATEITARQGRRLTGGTWSRPDIVSVEVRTFQYVPNKVLEVRTFEVKPVDSLDVQAVYEALAHRRAATHSYVILHVPMEKASTAEEDVLAVRTVARSHGVGVIVVGDPDDYLTWEEIEEAQRVEPDPDRLEAFIEAQLSESTKKKVAKATR